MKKTIKASEFFKLSIITIALIGSSNSFASDRKWDGDYVSCNDRITPWRLAKGIAEQQGAPFLVPQPTFGSHSNSSNTSCWTSFSVPDSDDNMILDSYTSAGNRKVFVDNSLHVEGLQVNASGYELQSDGRLVRVDNLVQISTGGTLDLDDIRIVSSQNTINSNSLLNLNAGSTLMSINTFVGFNGYGVLSQRGGNHILSGGLALGHRPGETGAYNFYSGNLSARNQFIGQNGIGSFAQLAGINTISDTLYIGQAGTAEGVYNLQGGTLNVNKVADTDGLGYLNIDGGTLNLTGSTLDVDILGVGMFANGNYTHTSGRFMNTSAEIIGGTKNGTYTQTGGRNNISSSLILGQSSGSNGTYNLRGGELNSFGQTIIGDQGRGTFTQSGGVFNATDGPFWLGRSGGIGTYNLSGGTLNVKEFLNGSGTSSLNISGGTLNHAGATINVDNFTLSSTNYTLPAGKNLNVSNQYINASTFTQSAGTNRSTNFYLADDNLGSTATYNLNGGNFVTTNFNIGGAFNTGIFNLNSGTFSANNVTIGTSRKQDESSVGIFNQNAGNYRPDNLYLAKGNRFMEGTYNLNGGNLAGANKFIGYDGKGTFNQNGGTHSTNDGGITLGVNENSQGTYNLNGGTLTTNRVRSGSGFSSFNIDGGTLRLSGTSKELDVNELAIGNARGRTGGHLVQAGETLKSDNITVGNFGNGTLTVNRGGSVITRDEASIGRAFGGTGRASINGTWDITNGLYVGGDATVNRGIGSLNVTSTGNVNARSLKVLNGNSSIATGNQFSRFGGQINLTEGLTLANGGSATSYYGIVNSRASNLTNSISAATVLIDGVGSSWDTNVFYVGFDGQGTASISNQGALTANSLFLGTLDGANGILNVASGATVNTGILRIGNSAASSGTLNVVGAGASVTANSMLVGSRGQGSLNIVSAATVNNTNATIGFLAGSSGNVEVGGFWNVSNALTVGSVGQGAVTVFSGGSINAGQLEIGNNGTLNNAGGIVSVEGAVSNTGMLTNGADLIVGSISSTGSIINIDLGTIDIKESSTLGGTVVNNGVITIAKDKLLRLTGDISGSGSFMGNTFLDAARVNPGNSSGTLSFADTTWDNVDLTLEIEQTLNGLEYDAINILGDLTLLSAFTINFDFLDGLDFSSLIGETVNYLTISGSIYDGRNCDQNGCEQVTDFSNFVNIMLDGWTGDWTSDGMGGYRFDLRFNNITTGVNEPSTILFMSLTLGGLLYMRKRRGY